MSDGARVVGGVVSGGAIVSGLVLVCFGACAAYCGNELSGGGQGAAGDSNGYGVLPGVFMGGFGLIAAGIGVLAILVGIGIAALLLSARARGPASPQQR